MTVNIPNTVAPWRLHPGIEPPIPCPQTGLSGPVLRRDDPGADLHGADAGARGRRPRDQGEGVLGDAAAGRRAGSWWMDEIQGR